MSAAEVQSLLGALDAEVAAVVDALRTVVRAAVPDGQERLGRTTGGHSDRTAASAASTSASELMMVGPKRR